jgi:hypothetical protein
VRTAERVRTVEVDGRRFEVRLSRARAGMAGAGTKAPGAGASGRRRCGGSDAVVSPMQGTVLPSR